MTQTTVRVEGDAAIIKMPLSEAHSLMVSVQECRCVDCKAARSISTTNIRDRFVKALASVIATKR